MSDAVPEFPSLTVHGGPLDGYDMKLSPGTTVIVGSGRLAHMRIDHPDIELAHVKVTWDVDYGISMVDNGSRKGTWVNGEPVETAGLLDGDVIEFAAPGAKSAPPRVKVHIPKGSVAEPPPPAPPTPEELAARPAEAPGPARSAARAKGKARRARRGPSLPDPRLLALALGAVVLVGGGGWFAKRLFFTAPQIDSVQPAQAEPGQTITVTGRRFHGDAEDNVVWFADRSTTASSIAGGVLKVKVPAAPRARTVRLTVESRGMRSNAVSFDVVMPLEAASLEPAGALPGDEVVLKGRGFAEGTSVTVGGNAARVTSAEPDALRFEMPAVEGARGSRHAVVASSGSRSTKPLALYLGRVPLVVSLEPDRGVAGTLVRVRGAGFAAAPDGNAVTFDGQGALVVAASPVELAVVAPPPARPQAETLAPVVVRVGDKTSSEGATFSLLRLVEGAWVPRFLAGVVGEGGAKGQATVGTEIAPVILLSWKDDSPSVGERALHVAAALNAAVDRARVGQAAAFEAREQPAVGVALVGAPDLLLRVTAQDAAAYETPPGLPVRGAPPTPLALAQHWAALLNDTFVVGTSGGKLSAAADALPPAAGAAFAQLRAALPWQYGSGISSARVLALPPELKRRLREAAFRVP